MRRPRVWALAFAIAVAVTSSLVLPAPAVATGGWLDPSFSEGGWIRLPPGDAGHVDLGITVTPSGEILVARGGFGAVQAFLLTAGGAPVSTFGGGGWQTVPRVAPETQMLGLFATGTGGVVGVQAPHLEPLMELGEVASTASVVRTERFHLPLDHPVSVRVRIPGGESLAGERGLDPEVVRTGRVVLAPEGSFTANALRLPGGSIRTCYADVGADERRLVGLSGTFAPDLRVGPSGHRAVPIEACDAIGMDASGHLYLAGHLYERAETQVVIIRTTTEGHVDGSWNGDGRAVIDPRGVAVTFPGKAIIGPRSFSHSASPIVAVPDGSLFIAASVSRWPSGPRQAAVIKLTPDGELDTTFDRDGIRAIGPADGQSRILAMVVDHAGRPVVSAMFNDEERRATRDYLARLTATGGFDPTFGDGGLIEQIHVASALAIDADGRILTAAWAGRTSGVFVARRNG